MLSVRSKAVTDERVSIASTSLSDLSLELRIASSSSSMDLTTSLRAATGVLQDSFEELVPSLAMEPPCVDSLEAVGSKDKLGLDGCEESEDSRVVCSDDVHGASLG